eukprot:Tbor_TRINITY_DN6042_c3_g1::TRINITY_DN6042_c3_g1_i1::g.10659::m.10659
MSSFLDDPRLPPSLFILNSNLTIAHYNLFCVPEMAIINTRELARYLWNCELISTTANQTAIEFDELGEITIPSGKKRGRPKTTAAGNGMVDEMEGNVGIIRLRMPTLYTSATIDDLADCNNSLGESRKSSLGVSSYDTVGEELGDTGNKGILLEHTNVSCTVASSGNVTVYSSKHPKAMYAICNYIRRYLCTAIMEHCPWCVAISAALTSSSVLSALKGRLPVPLGSRITQALAVPTSLEEILTCRDEWSWQQYVANCRSTSATNTSSSIVGESGMLSPDSGMCVGHQAHQGSINHVLVRLSRIRAALGWYKDRYYTFEQMYPVDGAVKREKGVESVPLHQFGFRISNITGFIYPTKMALERHHSNLLRTSTRGKSSASGDAVVRKTPAAPTNLGMTLDEFSVLKSRLEENAVRDSTIMIPNDIAARGSGNRDHNEDHAVENKSDLLNHILTDFDESTTHNYLYSVALASCFAGVGDIGNGSILADLAATRNNSDHTVKREESGAHSKLVSAPSFKDTLIRMMMRSRVTLTTNKNDTKLRFEVLCEGRTTEITITRRSGIIRLIRATSMEDVRILLLRGILPAAFGMEPILD